MTICCTYHDWYLLDDSSLLSFAAHQTRNNTETEFVAEFVRVIDSMPLDSLMHETHTYQ